MKGYITDIQVESGGFIRGQSITARVRLYGDPEEAHKLANLREVDMLPYGSLNFSVKVGDQIKYTFIRQGKTKAETSIWMFVKAVEGDVIVASNNGDYGPYSFRVLHCQIVQHKSASTKEVTTLVNSPTKLEDIVDVGYVDNLQKPKKKEWKKVRDFEASPKNDPLAELRKTVMEFTLT